MKTSLAHFAALALLLAPGAQGAGWLDRLGLGSKTTNPPAGVAATVLSQDQMVGGLKEALGKGVEQAVASLGKPDGFLKDLNVKDSYVTHKTLDGLFLKIAEQEKLIRENPAARTTELLQKVFGGFQK